MSETKEKSSGSASFDRFVDACRNGNLDAVKELYHLFATLSRRDGFEAAYAAGRCEVVKFLLTLDVPPDLGTKLVSTCESGHIAMAKIIYQYTPCSRTQLAMEGACSGDRMDIIEWLITEHKGADVAGYGFIQACENGRRAAADRMMGLDALSQIARMCPPPGIDRTNKIENMVYLCRANNWIDFANQFSMRLDLLFAPLTRLIKD